MKRIALLLLLATSAFAEMARPSFHTQGMPTGKPTGPLKPGEYWWKPEVSPSGPIIALVSIPQQTMNVYRNGILVARTSVSTGTKGRGTPSGVFTILEKEERHYSKKYHNAPMPNMQRLTWSGIAMHSGNLPGYPASHGCIRMPYDFSKLLFGLTTTGSTVVISDGKTAQPHFAANPGVLLAPTDFTPEMLHALADDEYDWNPERSPTGPITVLISGADRALYVYRNGNPIGRARVEIRGNDPIGNHVFALLEGTSDKPSQFVPGRPARRWMAVTHDESGPRADADQLAARLRFSPEFAGKLYDEISPGTTVVVTDQPAVQGAARDFTILTN